MFGLSVWLRRGLFGLFIGEKLRIISNFGVVILDRLQVAIVVEVVESIALIADMVDEKEAVEMVDFVEECAGEKITSLEADFLSRGEDGFDFDFLGAFNEAVNARNREATFVIFNLFTLGANDFRVDEGGEILVVFVFEIVANDDDALVNTDLWSGHSGGKFVRVSLFPSNGNVDHVANRIEHLGGNLANFGRFLT